ncbi:uncharacterized protein LOC117171661 [Belonocnema kinseyi]|uniref:uncharacterized protein LOC117171661 n=1 Tax=Belonocnema kinseyi TaxID=2817044 RepID=UPI00143DD5E9|nr:uncharacterized protein LOC117171661 [Belonocnema kinseyi]XP_033215070.1 uncharacterized protein LOC117171661 [Belonocnema kinseyi]
MIFFAMSCVFFLFVKFSTGQEANEIPNDIRPYEFAFNVVDFQHRFEKKDKDGIVTGEYGFITADGVYHETSYATDKDGDFIITKMRNRKLKSQEDMEEFFKDKPEVAKKIMAAMQRSCSDCNSLINIDKVEDGLILNGTVEENTSDKVFNGTNKVPQNEENPDVLPNINDIKDVRKGKTISNEDSYLDNDVNAQDEKEKEGKEEKEEKEETLGFPLPKENATISNLIENMVKDLSYRFNYSVSSHSQNEDGYRNGRKDGKYNYLGDDGVDVKVEYVSNEFGHQPNITIVPGPVLNPDEETRQGYSLVWYRK